jgi:hypothetical protein
LQASIDDHQPQHSCTPPSELQSAKADFFHLLSDTFVSIPHIHSNIETANQNSSAMSSFITNLFPSSQGGKHENIMPVPPPPLQTRNSQNETFAERPNTPNRNSFTTPVLTPQGSPSKVCNS